MMQGLVSGRQGWMMARSRPGANMRGAMLAPARAAAALGPRPLHAPRPLRAWPRGAPRTLVAAQASDMSFDADEELDSDLAAELSRMRQPDAWRKLQRQLDLAWDIRKSRGKRSVCSCCCGSGESECRWCHGTGAMMAGDTFLRAADGSSHCPVCKGKGHVACENCRGTGYRAAWLGDNPASVP